MATKYWLGTATAVAQVDTVQITAYDVTTTYTLTVGGVDVETLGVTDATGTATALAAAWNTSTHAYFTGVTASSTTDTVTLTADVAGVEFTAASSVTGGRLLRALPAPGLVIGLRPRIGPTAQYQA
jgi:hypothetical protein